MYNFRWFVIVFSILVGIMDIALEKYALGFFLIGLSILNYIMMRLYHNVQQPEDSDSKKSE